LPPSSAAFAGESQPPTAYLYQPNLNNHITGANGKGQKVLFIVYYMVSLPFCSAA